MFNLEPWAEALLIISMFVCCIAVGIAMTIRIYRKELAEFLSGQLVENKHKVHMTFETKELPIEDKEEILQNLEKNLNNMRFIWRRKGSDYCGFHGLFFSPRMKCVVTFLNYGNDKFNLKFAFYDRYLQPIMISWNKIKYEHKMRQMFARLSKSLYQQ